MPLSHFHLILQTKNSSLFPDMDGRKVLSIISRLNLPKDKKIGRLLESHHSFNVKFVYDIMQQEYDSNFYMNLF